jgi:predicted nucleotidyltransferase
MAVSTTTAVTEHKRELEVELARIVRILIERYQPEKIILFGSLASGRVHEWSDMDLCIIKETEKRFVDRGFEVAQLFDSEMPVNIFVYTPQEFESNRHDHYFFRDEIEAKGRVLYDAKGAAKKVA